MRSSRCARKSRAETCCAAWVITNPEMQKNSDTAQVPPDHERSWKKSFSSAGNGFCRLKKIRACPHMTMNAAQQRSVWMRLKRTEGTVGGGKRSRNVNPPGLLAPYCRARGAASQ